MNKIINANCLDGLKELPDNSVDSIVTDPPYGLSFMGKSWDYDVPKVEIWRECLRVLKPGGHLLSFFGTRTYHRGVVQIEDAGFEIRDQIGWAYGSGFPKSHNLKGDWQGWGTALKPAWEPICVARKPFKGTVAENVLEHGTGAINIDGCRVDYQGETPNMGGRGAAKMGWESSGFKVEGRPVEANTAGRWPANVIHDGSEEVLAQFPNTKPSRAANRGLCNSGCLGGQHDTGPTRKEGTDYIRGHNDLGGSAARFFYCAKTSKTDRNEGCEDLPVKQTKGGGGLGESSEDLAAAARAYGSVKAPARNFHPTVKPTDLMRYLCRLVTPPGGIVLDPFAGSGSTGKAAVLEGFGFIGMEREAEYCQIAEKRIAAAKAAFLILGDI